MPKKKRWVIPNAEVEKVQFKRATDPLKEQLAQHWVRIMVDGEAFFVPAFKEADYEA